MLRPWYAVLSDRTAVALSGSDAALVWHNLSTNLAVCGPCHLLNAQGRLLFAAFVGRSEHQQLIVDVDTAVLPQFQRHVAMYALRKDVRLAPLPRMHVVHAEGLGGGGCVDRRFGDAAERRYCETLPDVERNDARYDTLRRLNGISESFAELSLGKAVSLECNLDRQGGVSFDKGCYLGQELVSRTHFSGVVRKRLMAVVVAPRDAPEPPPDLVAPDSARPVAERQAEAVAFLATTAAASPEDKSLVDAGGRECGTIVGYGAEFPSLALAMLRLSHVGQPLFVGNPNDGLRAWALPVARVALPDAKT